MEIAALGVRIDSDGALTASQRLDKFSSSATKAETVAGSLARAATNSDRSARGVASSATAGAGALANMATAASSNVVALNSVVSAATKVNANVSRMGGSMSGLAAQFQDIGVTAAMGMNPLQIALQQGTQIAGQMEMAMQSGSSAIGVLTQGFKSLLSPVAIVSIGLTALAAAGLQMVDWASVGAGALNLVADGLELVAPYAASAAAGLALIYSPAIIGGLLTLVGSLGGVAQGVMGIATAIYAAVGLPALLIAGFVALVAAAVIWRDDLTEILGVDIVGAAQSGINFIIGAFVGGFDGIRETWAALPGAVGDLIYQAAQTTADGVIYMIREVQVHINDLLTDIDGLLAKMGSPVRLGTMDLMGYVDLGNPFEGQAAAAGTAIGKSVQSAMGIDYVGDFISGVQDMASGAADALRGIAGSLGENTKLSKEAAREAKRQAEAYADITRGAQQFIAAQQLEQQALGMTAEAANRLRYEQDLLNKAANDNIKLTPTQRNELMGLAAQMASVEEATRRVTEMYNFGRDVFAGMFADLKAGLKEGQGFWEALGNTAANALDKIADRALSMAANGIFDMIFGSLFGGFGGNSLGGGWGVPGGFGRPGIFGIPGMATGGTVAKAGLSWVGERGPELLSLPRGAQVIPNGPSMAMAANQNQAPQKVEITVRVEGARGNAEIQQMVAAGVSQGLKGYDRQLPNRMQEIQMRQG